MGKITTGSFREDEEDVVFHYTKPPGYPLPKFWQTNSHFWNADEGDEALSYLPGLGWGHSDYWKNAYQKFRYFRDGNWRYENGAPSYINILAGTGTFQYMYYDGLPELYRTGRVWCESFTDHASQIHDIREWRYLNENDKNLIVWEILGRMCHLLQDQTVPAHTHCDIHPYNPVLLLWNQPDSYENWVHSEHTQISRHNAGDFIYPYYGSDPLRYLFYTANQLGDHFPSDWRNNGAPPPEFSGDNNLPNGGGNDMLSEYYNQLGSPPNTVIPSAIMQINLKHAIRATAGLLYWFITSSNTPMNSCEPRLNGFSFNLAQQRVFAREIGTLTANISNVNYYSWQYYKCGGTTNGCGNYYPLPNGLMISGSGNQSVIRVFDNYVNQQCTDFPTNCGNNGLLRFTFRVIASSSTCGLSTEYWYGEIMPVAGIRPPPSGGGGCPYLYVWNNDSTYYLTDNNLLHRSEFTENVNQDITDKYKLLIQPNLNLGQFSVQIGENESDHDYFDCIKLYAVDHPVGTTIGITEFNDVVMYDNTSVESPDDATQNGSNITPYIQYYYQGKKIVSGDPGDSTYAHYDSSAQMKSFSLVKKKYRSVFSNSVPDSVALIGESDREFGGGPKTPGGLCDIFIGGNPTPLTRSFALRENMSEVIIPFATTGDAVDHIDINWTSDYSVTYFAVVPVMYSGFDITELPIATAFYSVDNQNVTPQLLNIDQSYVELDSSQYISVMFDSIPEPQSGYIRDYVIETRGRYEAGGSLLRPFRVLGNNFDNTNAISFKLHTNYPNPFNPKSLIRYDIGNSVFVKISVYNILGQIVNVLINEQKPAGSYAIEFDGSNLPSGLYIYKIEAGDFVDAKKMLLIK